MTTCVEVIVERSTEVVEAVHSERYDDADFGAYLFGNEVVEAFRLEGYDDFGRLRLF